MTKSYRTQSEAEEWSGLDTLSKVEMDDNEGGRMQYEKGHSEDSVFNGKKKDMESLNGWLDCKARMTDGKTWRSNGIVGDEMVLMTDRRRRR